MSKSYVGDIGTAIILDACSDISTGTVFEIRYKKPDGTTGVWTASLEGTEQVKYVTASGAGNGWDLAGTWEYQAYVASPAWTGLGDTVQHRIYAAFT